jgi:hypothetical protein
MGYRTSGTDVNVAQKFVRYVAEKGYSRGARSHSMPSAGLPSHNSQLAAVSPSFGF